MKTKFSGILTLFLAFVVQISFAQQKTIAGTIADENNLPLPGVNVVVSGTNAGAQTDFDGNYSIGAPIGSTITYSFVGYKTIEKTVGGANNISFAMEVDVAAIEEVVIVAYGATSTKPTSNVAVQSVSSQTIETRPNASLIQTLQGQASGLNITTGSGQPGANSEINLRGVGSINGNTEPLFIMDGIPIDQDNFRSLNPSEISSVSILKDAGATAIYGNRGANGVVIITTKRGKYNSEFKVNYTSITSISNLQANDYNLMNSTEQLQLERTDGTGRGAGLGDAEIAAIARYANTDWVNVFFRQSLTQNHTLNFSNGGKNVNTFTSLGYFEQKGILVQSGLQRFNFRSNVSGKSKDERFNYGTSLSLNFSKNNEPNAIGGGAVNRNFVLGAYQSLPYIAPEEYVPGEGGSIPPQFSLTPLLLLDRLATYERTENEIKMLANINFSYKLSDYVTANTSLGADFTEEQRLRTEGPDSFNSVFFAGVGEDLPGTQDQQMTRTIGLNVVNSLIYANTFNDLHTLDAGIYTEYFKAHLRTFGFRAQGLDPRTFFPGDGGGFVDDNGDNDFYIDLANANINNAGLFSYFANANYDYDKKYGFGATIRRDASYRFSSTNRWGTFYSVSGRWNIDKESFMATSPFSLLKLRASYGTTGNQDIVGSTGQFAPFGGANLTLDTFITGSGYGNQNSIVTSQIGNSNLKWETITQGNIGLDWEVFNSRFSGSLDFYNKETSDVFQFQPTAAYTGTTGLFVNSGELINKGVDLTLRYDVLKSDKGLNLKVNFVGNYNKSERFGANDSTIEEGGKLFQYYSLDYAGVNPATGNILFVDINGNLTENPDPDTDRKFTDKNRFPDYQGSFGFDVDYKGFFVTTQFNYIIGVDRFDNDYAGFIDPDNIGNFRHSRDILRAWTPDNRVTDIPSLDATNLDLAGTRFLQSADYLRLRFVNFGYSFSREQLDAFKLNSVKIFVNAENLVTLSGWRGYDAESTIANGSRNYPTPRSVSFGLEIGL